MKSTSWVNSLPQRVVKRPDSLPPGGRGTVIDGGRRVRKLKIRCYTQVTHSPSVTYGGRARKCKSDVVILKYKIFYTQLALKSLQDFQIFTKSFQKNLKKIKKGLPPPQKRGAKATKIYKNANRRRKNAVFLLPSFPRGVDYPKKQLLQKKSIQNLIHVRLLCARRTYI